MAVRADQDALRELGRHALPAPRDAVGRDREFLRRGIEVVEVQDGDRSGKTAARARTAGSRDRAKLESPTKHRNRVITRRPHRNVPEPVAVRADEDAFLDLPARPLKAAEKPSESEPLRRRVSMMEIQRPHAAGVSTVFAPAAARPDELALDALTSALAVARPRLLSSDDWVDERPAGAVVRSERRALEAEAAIVQIPTSAADEHSCREHPAAGSADLHRSVIGMALRARPCSPRRTRTSDPAITRSPRFPSDVDYLITVTVAGP